MWRRKDSKRFIPSDIGRRLRAASFHNPDADHAQRRALGEAIRMDCQGQTQIGRTRRVNQDLFFTVPLGTDEGRLNCLLGVADGIGGAPGGEEASSIAVETLTRFVQEESPLLLRPERNDGEIVQILTRGLQRCHAELQELVERHPDHSGMGTTLTAGLILWPHLYVVHLGDARAYLIRDGALRQLTHDQTYGQALLEAGVLTAATIRTSAMRNVLSNYLSGDLPEKDPEVHPEVRVDLLQPGDTLLFSTDGLTDVVPDETLLKTLTQDEPSGDLCRTLLDLARQREARDDSTVLIARFNGGAIPPGGRRQSH